MLCANKQLITNYSVHEIVRCGYSHRSLLAPLPIKSCHLLQERPRSINRRKELVAEIGSLTAGKRFLEAE